jgi:adenylyltransferase/sulfurtransferase
MRLISEYDIVVDGTDNFETRLLISDVCQKLNKPFVYAAIGGLEGQVAVLCKGSATYRTLFPELPSPSDTQTGKEVVGVTPAVVGSVAASQVLQLICGYGEPLIDRLWSIDLRTLQCFTIDI